jgi:hypothetical protein
MTTPTATTTAATPATTPASTPATPTDTSQLSIESPAITPAVRDQSQQPILGILSLVFGITGIVTTLIFPFSVAGLVLGILALRREPQARTMAVWGTVLSGIPGALIVLVGVFAVLILVPLGLIAAVA